MMDIKYLRDLLEEVQSGRMNPDSVIDELRELPFQDLGYARIDNHRSIRKGVPEVITCQGKTIEHIRGIVKQISKSHQNIMATRASLVNKAAARRAGVELVEEERLSSVKGY